MRVACNRLTGWITDSLISELTQLTVQLNSYATQFTDSLCYWLSYLLAILLNQPLINYWMIGWLMDQPGCLTFWLINCLNNWLSDHLSDWLKWLIKGTWPTCSLAAQLSKWLTDQLIIEWLIEWQNDWLTDCLAKWLTDYVSSWLTDWLADRLTY